MNAFVCCSFSCSVWHLSANVPLGGSTCSNQQGNMNMI